MLSFKTIKKYQHPFKKIYKDAFDYGFSSPNTEKKYYSQM